MSTKDRRLRERGEREQRFLDKAQELIQRDGLLSLQMARIAEECDYAIGTLYQHFASKEDLLVTLATRNCLSRVHLFERAAHWRGPSRERMLAIALADLMVIRAQPEHFRLAQFVWTDVVWGAASALTRQRSLEASAPLGALIDGIVEDAIAAGDLRADIGLSPHAVTIGPWTLSMGMHTLTHAEGLLEAYALGDPYRLLMKHLHFLLNGTVGNPCSTRPTTSRSTRSMRASARQFSTASAHRLTAPPPHSPPRPHFAPRSPHDRPARHDPP